MARHTFGGSISDWAFTFNSDGTVSQAASAPIAFWDSLTGGNQYPAAPMPGGVDDGTGLLDGTGVPVTTVTTDANGEIPDSLQGPDGVTRMAADGSGSGVGPRRWIYANDLGDTVNALLAQLATLEVLGEAPVIVEYDDTLASYPARPLVTSPVWWIGATAPPIGGLSAAANDVWLNTTGEPPPSGVTAVTAADTSIIIGGTPAAPTIKAGPLAGYDVSPSGDTTGATDTANIQAALTAAGAVNGAVRLASGLYYVNQTLEIYGGTGLYGHANAEAGSGVGGTVIQQVAGSNLNALLAAQGWLEGINISARGAVTIRGVHFLGETTQTSGAGHLVVLQSYGARVHHCYFEKPAGDALRFDVFGFNPSSFSYTATSASPAVFTATGSTYTAGTLIQLNGGTPPAGFTNGTAYYVVNPGVAGAGTFELAATVGGTAINSTSTGSGSQTLNTAQIPSADDCMVWRNNFQHVGGIGFNSTDTLTTGSVYSDSYLDDNIFGVMNGAAAINVGNAADWAIRGNHIFTVQQNAIVAGRTSKTTLWNNRIDDWGNTTTAGTYYAIDCGWTSFSQGKGIIVANNRISGGTPGNTGSTIHGIAARTASGNTMSLNFQGNSLIMAGAGGAWAGQAIKIGSQSGTGTTVILATGNDISGPWASPAYALPGSGTVTVRGDLNRGTATLVAGTATVSNIAVQATSLIRYSRQAAGGTLGFLSVSRVAGTSFTITSSSNTDTSVIAWEITEP